MSAFFNRFYQGEFTIGGKTYKCLRDKDSEAKYGGEVYLTKAFSDNDFYNVGDIRQIRLDQTKKAGELKLCGVNSMTYNTKERVSELWDYLYQDEFMAFHREAYEYYKKNRWTKCKIPEYPALEEMTWELRNGYERIQQKAWSISVPASYGQAKQATKGTKQMIDTQSVDVAELVKNLNEAIKVMKKPSALEEKLLNAVIAKTQDIATAQLEEELKGKLDKFIYDTYGMVPKTVNIVVNKDTASGKSVNGLFHTKFADVLTMVANNIPVMVTGAAGTGKNYLMEQVSEALGIEFYYTGAITQEYKLTGFIDAGGRFHETEFYKAFKNGGLFMLDEIDASSAETLVLLNAAIANKYFDFPSGRIKAHEDFRIVCAGNTFGTGADMVYVGRNVLDGATLDRFVVIKMDYDNEVEKLLCPDEEFYQFITGTRAMVDKFKLRHIIGMRASINGYKSLQAGMSKAFVIESIVMKGLNVDDVAVMVKNLQPTQTGAWYEELRRYFKAMEATR